jgi:DNA-binding transcriptional regulator YiaG
MPSPLNTTEQRAAHLASQGAAIRQARHRAGLSQPAAAAQLGVSVWTLRSWEHGLRACPPEARRRIVAEWGGDAGLLGPGADACACCGRPW